MARSSRSSTIALSLVSLSVAALSIAGLPGCSEGTDPRALTNAAGAASPLEIEEIESPAGPGSLAPFLSTDGDRVVLSWLEPVGDQHALRFATLDGDGWATPGTVIRGADLFVNWADVPSVVQGTDGGLTAHWLADLGDSPYAYGVRIARSGDGGGTWSDPAWLHEDTSPVEHGFVSLVPRPGGGTLAVWLDGRRFVEGAGPDGGARPATEEMTLRSANVGPDGEIRDETPIDRRVCDCCPTSATATNEGIVVAYRNRTEEEIRDIWVSRLEGGNWSPPTPVAEDGWKIPGCPVNGPAVDAAGSRVAVAWFTLGGGAPAVRIALSDDGGRSFGPPVRTDGGTPLGRVDLVFLEDGDAAVLWLEKRDGAAELRLRRMGPEGALGEPVVVATTGASRSSGIPRMVASGTDLVLAWRETGDAPRIRTGRLAADRLPGSR